MEHGCPAVTRPDGSAGAGAVLRPRRTAGRRGGQDDDRPLPRPGLAGPRLLRHAAPRHPRPRLRPRHGRPRATPTTTSTSGSGRISSPLGADAAPGGRLPGRGHLRRRPARPAPRPVTRCPPRRTRGWSRRGTCPPRSCRSRSRRPPAPTRTGSPTALARLVAEDPTVRLERRPDTGQLLLWCVGRGARRGAARAAAHPARRRREHGARPGAHGRDPRRRRRGSPAGTSSSPAATASTRSSSSRPSREPPGSGVVFEQRIVGGTVPSQFHGSVEKGIRTQAERGIAGDRPLVDVHVTLVDGKAHSVDSSDAAFQAAGALALRELAAAAGTRVLEPWCEVEVVVPGEYVGRGDERPVRPARPGHRQRGRSGPRPDDGARRGAGGGAAQLSRACCARSPTGPAASPAGPWATSRRPASVVPVRLPSRPRPGPDGSPRASRGGADRRSFGTSLGHGVQRASAGWRST